MLDRDLDARHQGVLCEQKERVIEDKNPEVGSKVNQDIQKAGDDALWGGELILQTGSLEVEESLPDELCNHWQDVHKARSQHSTCVRQLLIELSKIFHQH